MPGRAVVRLSFRSRRLAAPERFDVERRLAALEGGGDQLRISAGGETIIG